MTGVRTPPRPPHEHTRGACSLCGTTPLPGRRRSWCSDECVRIWNLATLPLMQRNELEGLHGHACWECGHDGDWRPGDQPTRWTRAHWDAIGYRPEFGPPEPIRIPCEVDHVRPLWSLTPEQRLELRWWLPFNLQLLCTGCHKAKTRREAAQRASMRRGDPPPPGPGERAYYLAWSSTWGEPCRAWASRQDGWVGGFTELLDLEVDEIGARRRDLVHAILEDHLGRAPGPDEVDAIPAGHLRLTTHELERLLAPTRQLALFGGAA